MGKALNARSAIASRHVPPMTISRFPRIVFDPAPPDKAPAYAGGGEASALADVAKLKRYGRVTMTPNYGHPEPVLEAVTMDGRGPPGGGPKLQSLPGLPRRPRLCRRGTSQLEPG